MSEPILLIENLTADYLVREGLIRAVDNVSLEVRQGELLGIIGESGSGKTTLLQAITRVGPLNFIVRSGRVLYRNVDLLKLPDVELRRLLGTRIGFVFQAAQNSLNPFYRVRDHFYETLSSHYPDLDKVEMENRAIQYLELMHLNPNVLNLYPHQLSGGMKQRVVIALVLSTQPELVLLDEPVSALDLITQRSIVANLKEINTKYGTTMVYVTHDVESLIGLAHRIAIYYGGKIVEVGSIEQVLKDPLHPYTKALIDSLITTDKSSEEVKSIPGNPPSLLVGHKPQGCVFHPRCPYVKDICKRVEPPMLKLGDRRVACHLYKG
ncbi:ABC transporter ATP-binding protein [Infirmifilum sp.]|jgi:peptide/nickel transport system ATP-binding protein|uniref:ABC transporter ATP-binding protein n=1 Tax=Infirmifilum sp. TaxID=2856575 RepID=UPI003D13FA31